MHNPRAGDAVATEETLRSMLESAGFRVRLTSTHADWTAGLQPAPDIVVAAGGDGTARAVALALNGTPIPIAVLPFGTANNVGKTLGMIGNAADLIEGWRSGSPAPLDLGVSRLEGANRPFLESIGAGLFADLIEAGPRDVEEHPVFVGRETDRALHLFRAIATAATARHWQVTVDGKDESGDYVGVEVMNMRFIGPNIPLAPAADPGDGLLDVALIDASDRDALASYAYDRLALASAALPRVRVIRGRSVAVVAPDGERIHLDDEIVGLARGDDAARTIEVEIDAGACRVMRRG